MSIVAWRVSTYDRAPIRKEFARETSAFYIAVDQRGKERKEKKESTWWRYFTDEQESLDFIAARDAAKEKRAQEDRAERLLIAAAPELLEALEWMVENDDTYEGDEPLPDHHGATWNEINAYWLAGLNKARAAIAKARGDA